MSKYVKKTFCPLLPNTRLLGNVDALFYKLNVYDEYLPVLSIYRSPSSTRAEDQPLITSIKIIAQCQIDCFILDDFKVPAIDWKSSYCLTNDSFNNLLLDVAEEYFKSQNVMQPTRFRSGQRPSTPNLIFSCYPSLVSFISLAKVTVRCFPTPY